MRVHYLQHAPFEGLGSIGSWLESRAADVTVTRLFEEPRFPDVHSLDWLIVMGGPMSVNDTSAHPWLLPEKDFIASAIRSSKIVLGICLGAQLIAASLGAKVLANQEREIGWHPIEPTPGASRSIFSSILHGPIEAFHWPGETFELPSGATLLARSEACEHQAFCVADRVLGLQFHFEINAESARALIENCRRDLEPGRWVQSASEMVRESERFERINRVMDAVLDRLEALSHQVHSSPVRNGAQT